MTLHKFLQVPRIIWKIKKNRRNWEVIHLIRDDDVPHLCPVQAAFHIVSRENKLGKKLDLPLGIFLDDDQKGFFILNRDKIFRVLSVHSKRGA